MEASLFTLELESNPTFDDLEEGGSGAQQAKTTMDGLAGVATAAGSMAAAQRAADKWSARTERAARPAHTLPALIGQLMTLRTGLQSHRAELAQALDMIKEGTQPGASPEAKAEAKMVEALLGDIAEETELVTLAHEKAAADKDEPMQLSFRAQKRGPLERIEQQAVPAELEPGYLRPGEALPIFGLPGPTPEAQIMQAAADTHRRSVLG